MSKDKEPYAKILVKVPRGILQFWEDYLHFIGAKETAVELLTEDAENTIISITGDMLCQVSDTTFFDGINEVVEKYGLHKSAESQNIELKNKEST